MWTVSGIIWLSSHLLFKNTKIKIYATVILSLVLYGCETWYDTLRKEQYHTVFKNMVLRRSKKKEATGGWKKLPNKELDDFYSHQILGLSSPGHWDGWSIWHIWGKRAIYRGCQRGNLKERHHQRSISFFASWDSLCLVLVIYIAVVDLPGVVELFI